MTIRQRLEGGKDVWGWVAAEEGMAVQSLEAGLWCVGALKAAEGCVEGWCVGVLKVTGCVVLKAGVLGC